MSTEAIDRTRRGVSSSDRDERAQRAVKAFRQMQFGLSSYARAITGNPRVRVELQAGPVPQTDGTTIYYRPPIELGDKTPHDRFFCDKRGDDGLQSCPACRVREEVLVNVYHEIAHIAFETFAPTAERDRLDAIRLAVREWGGKYAQQLERKFSQAPQNVMTSYMGLSGLISPFLPHLFNSLEDARVDASMFTTRKGIRKMLEADTINLLKQGVEDAEGNTRPLSESPLNSQITLAAYLSAVGFDNGMELLHPKVQHDIADEKLQGYLSQIVHAHSVSVVYEVTFPILARLRELGYLLLPEEEEDEPEGSDEQEAPPESGDRGEQDDPADESAEPEADADGSDSDDRGGDPDEGSGEDEASAEADRDGSDEGGSREPSGDGDAEEASESPVPPEDDAPVEAGPEAPDHGREEAGGEVGEGGDSEDPASESGDGADEESRAPKDGEAEAAAGDQSGGNSDVPPDAEGEVDGDAGDDPLPEGDGGPGAGHDEHESGDPSESDSSGDGDDQPADGPNGASDSAPSSSSDGGGEESGGDAAEPEAPAGTGDPGGLESGDGGSGDADSRDGRGREGCPELDGDRGDSGDVLHGDDPERAGADNSDLRAEGDPAPEAGTDHHEGEAADDAEVPGERDDSGGDEGPGSEASGPVEVLESGADKGEGGIDLTDKPLPEKGTHEDVSAAMAHAHVEHDTQGELATNEEKLDARAILTAIIQGLYFETPSMNVGEVQEHQFVPGNPGWDTGRFKTETQKVQFGILCDTEIPESVLGPNLLKMRRIFSDNKTADHQRNLKSGRVNSKVLGRRAWSGDERLFAKKRVPGKKDYAVMIGMDISSSNLGDNLALLKRSVMAQAELLHRAGIPFSIVAHSASANTREQHFIMNLHHVKPWDKQWDSISKEALATIVATGGNLDGHAMEYMRKSMEPIQATDKILLYYTDGKMPAANKEEELEVLIRQIKLCRRDGLTLLGVGMQTDSPVRHGLDTVQVNDDADLKLVVDHLGKRLMRGAR